MALANKYRPQTFDTIIWQEHITDILKAQIQAKRKIHHNYLFFWPRGTGKTTAARILAKAINCKQPINGNPCNTCDHCMMINQWTTLDYVEIDAASHTGVDNIREEILDKAWYPPTSLAKKIYVIDEVHMLSKWAFNALLKTIEEPKDNVCFILATTELQKVPETIISRCQVFNFKKVEKNKIHQHLQSIVNQEQLTATGNALDIIAKISEWCVRDAIKYLDQVSVLGNITEEYITKFLGIASDMMIQDIIEDIKQNNLTTLLQKIDDMYAKGIDLHHFAKQVLVYIDQIFLENIPFAQKTSEIFSEIIANMRNYPYPTIIYKITFVKHLQA